MSDKWPLPFNVSNLSGFLGYLWKRPFTNCRLLEEGKVSEAEEEKLRVEQVWMCVLCMWCVYVCTCALIPILWCSIPISYASILIYCASIPMFLFLYFYSHVPVPILLFPCPCSYTSIPMSLFLYFYSHVPVPILLFSHIFSFRGKLGQRGNGLGKSGSPDSSGKHP